MKNLFITAIALLFVFPVFSQIEVISNGNVKIGNPSTSWQRLTVDGVIKSSAIYATDSGSVFKTASAEKFFDDDDYSYYLDPNGVSRMNDVDASRFRDINYPNFFLDPHGTSNLHNVHASKIWDRNNTAYYLNPNGLSNLHNVQATKIIDRNDTNFYVDPHSISMLKITDSEFVKSNSIMPANSATQSSIGGVKSAYDDIWTQTIHYNWSSGFSDERTKENIEDMKNPMDKLMSLTAKTFDYKASMPNYGSGAVSLGSHLKNRQGFIAQEVKEIMPELVEFDETSGLHKMNYVELIPTLVKAIQEQQKQIDALNQKLAK